MTLENSINITLLIGSLYGTITADCLDPKRYNSREEVIEQIKKCNSGDCNTLIDHPDSDRFGIILNVLDFSCDTLSGLDLRKLDLSEGYFKGSVLKGTKLDSANLYWANFKEANLDSASLHGTNLEEATLSKSNINYADFSASNLSKADLKGVKGFHKAKNIGMAYFHKTEGLTSKDKKYLSEQRIKTKERILYHH